MYEMKPEYYTGIAQIDEEHKKLFEIADEAYELYKNEFIPDKYDHIAKILNELRDYTKIHFQHEEEYMKSINYKGMFMQKVQHERLQQGGLTFLPKRVRTLRPFRGSISDQVVDEL